MIIKNHLQLFDEKCNNYNVTHLPLKHKHAPIHNQTNNSETK